MSYGSFEKLVGLLQESLVVQQDMAALRGCAILSELSVYVTLWYLAGGSYTDILYLVGISQPLFYHVLWKTFKAINSCTELQISWPNTKDRQLECATGFTCISTNRALHKCITVLDGYHLPTTTPSKKEICNVRSYFSGHYQTYGVNIQVVCNRNCHFLFIGLADPGVMGTRQAISRAVLRNT